LKIFLKLSLIILICILNNHEALSQAAFNTGKIQIRVNRYGDVELWVPNGSQNILNTYRTSILVGVSANQVFDYYNDSQNQDTVKVDTAGGNLRIYGSFNNHYNDLPPEVLIKLEVFGWKNSSYAVLKFNIQNKDTLPINAIAGLEIIPQLEGTPELDTVEYLTNTSIIDIFEKHHIGYKLLSGQLASLKAFEYYDGFEIDSNYFSWLNYGIIDQFFTSNDTVSDNGSVVITSQAPVILNPNDSIIVYYALAYANSVNQLISNIASAENKYLILTSADEKQPVIADRIELYQNYPNPFNPSTIIEFRLPGNSEYTELKIYDILGKEIATLVSDNLPAGSYKYTWDGSGLASGVYFYRIKSGSFIETRKMILLR